MGKFQAIPKYFIVYFLALVACNNSLLTHARPIKPLKQHSSLNTGSVVPENNNVPTSLSKKKVPTPIMQSFDVAGNFDDSGATHANAFRPTTPGSSPGVGHRNVAVEDKNMKTMVVVKSPDVKLSATERSDSGLKPTNPGHSPGVGHAYQTKIGPVN